MVNPKTEWNEINKFIKFGLKFKRLQELESKLEINTSLKSLTKADTFSISVDCVIFGYDESKLSILLIDCNMDPFKGKMSLIGELINKEETLEEAAERILFQTTGLKDIYMEQVSVFSKTDRHPLGRVISVSFYALLKTDNHILNDSAHKNLQWFPLKDIKDLAFDHNLILNDCVQRLRRRLRERPIGFSLLPKKFTLIQLQKLYEIILDVKLDKRNFRRKLDSTQLLIDLDENQQDVAHRPAKLFSFDYNLYKIKKENRTLKFDL